MKLSREEKELQEEKCLKHMRAGRATVEGMAEKLVHEEQLEMIRRHRIVLQKLHGQRRVVL